MPSLQDIKSVAERLTGVARPRLVLPRPVYGANGPLIALWRAG